MSMHFGDLAAQAAENGSISADEILALRQAGWADGQMEPEEAESLFSANDALSESSPEWCDFFVEALSEFVVNTVEPHGYVDQEMADELMSRIDHDGRVETMAELELLVRVLEKALNAPDNLKAYALQQIEAIVLSSEGATRHGELTADGINATECALLRRVVFASGGDRPAAVSQREAEMLFRIKDATLYETNAAEWRDLFVKGAANYLLGFGGHEALTLERAGELHQFMESQGAGVGAFLIRVLTSKPDFEGFASLLRDGDEPVYLDELDDEAAAAAELEASEESWLHDQLEADEELDELEKALIAFIDAETGGTFVPRPAVTA